MHHIVPLSSTRPRPPGLSDQICKFSRKFKASAWLMYDTAFRYMTASNLSIAWGKVNEQLYNDILKEETQFPTAYAATPMATAHSPALPGLSLPSPIAPPWMTPPLPCRTHLTCLPPPLSHHLPSSNSPQPSAVTSTVAAAAAPTVNSCTSATNQTVAKPTLVPSAPKELKPSSASSFMPPSLTMNIAYLAVD